MAAALEHGHTPHSNLRPPRPGLEPRRCRLQTETEDPMIDRLKFRILFFLWKLWLHIRPLRDVPVDYHHTPYR